jgi:hypothetical protein
MSATRYFEMHIELREQGEQSFDVTYTVSKYIPAKLYGDDAHPEEPSEIEIILVTDSEGREIQSEGILQCALELAEEHEEEL